MSYTIIQASPEGFFEIINQNQESVFIGSKKQCNLKLTELKSQTK